jgi:hypothetical protein
MHTGPIPRQPMPGRTSMPSVEVAASPEHAMPISAISRHCFYVCIDAIGSITSINLAWQAVAQTLSVKISDPVK